MKNQIFRGMLGDYVTNVRGLLVHIGNYAHGNYILLPNGDVISLLTNRLVDHIIAVIE